MKTITLSEAEVQQTLIAVRNRFRERLKHGSYDELIALSTTAVKFGDVGAAKVMMDKINERFNK